MSRQRRRRGYAETDVPTARREDTNDERDTKVMFMEEVDYKMEIEHQ
jgi:hypothetical protein